MKKMLTFLSACALSLTVSAQSWQEISDKARGQTVYFHAWGGSQEINSYLRWSADQLQARYGVTLQHVKVADIAETTTRLIAEKAAGKNQQGSVDLVWINGENFKSMKNSQLLYGPFVDDLPNWQNVDKTLPVYHDFSEPTEGLEAPWGVGQLIFIHDKQQLNNPPSSFAELLSYAKSAPNRISYPQPPEFHGTSFLKAALIELTQYDPALNQAVDPIIFEQLTQPLWQYLDELHAVAWRKGKQFPAGSAQMMQLLDDGQLDLAINFNPNAVFSAQASGLLEPTTQSYALKSGALTNIHFLAIPWNANAKEGALVAINFLLSDEAQSRKGDLSVWGDPSVLKNQNLTGSAKKTILFPAIAEPHPSWQSALEAEWQKRYGNSLK